MATQNKTDPLPDVVYIKARISLLDNDLNEYSLKAASGTGFQYPPYQETLRRVVNEGYASTVQIIPLEVYTEGNDALVGTLLPMRFLCVYMSKNQEYNWADIAHDIKFYKEAISREKVSPEDLYDFYFAIKRDAQGNWNIFGLLFISDIEVEQ